MQAPAILRVIKPTLLSLFILLGGCEDRPKRSVPQRSSPRPSAPKEETQAPAKYVGRNACKECHADIMKRYTGSQHDEALQVADAKTVLAPFSGEVLKGKHISAKFRRTQEQVIIEGHTPHPVKWTIGIEPLQQYLIETSKGRVQTFAAAYDTRDNKKENLGWYFLDDLDVPEGDILHWQGTALNWNFMCADCHSTNLQKNYDFESDTYKTTFSEIDVSCEACHGPASRHIEYAKRSQERKTWPKRGNDFGFERHLNTQERKWTRQADARIATLEGGDKSAQLSEVDACAPCHSRRADLGNIKSPTSNSYFERYLLQRLDSDLYFADGQIKEEVYVYGSFMQSKMYKEGVTCSDCHDPHTAALRAPEEQLCFQCHDPVSYNQPRHHMHPAAAGANSPPMPTCVDCHMPQRTYMGVDKRRDHRMGIPRPALSAKLGSPSACTNCHQNKDKQWATTAITQHYGKERPHSFALAFHAAERNSPQAARSLALIVSNQEELALIRASALGRWSDLGEMSHELAAALKLAAKSKSPILRVAAAEGSTSLPASEFLALLKPLWTDELRSVRVAAAMAAVTRGGFPRADEALLRKTLEEAKISRVMDSDSMEGALALASIELRLNNAARALEIYKITTERFPTSEVAYLNWADALRSMNREKEAGAVLKKGLTRFGQKAELNHARGLWLIRQKRKLDAILPLKKSFQQASPAMRRRYGYVFAIAVYETGKVAQSIEILQALLKEYPQAPEIKQALSTYQK